MKATFIRLDGRTFTRVISDLSQTMIIAEIRQELADYLENPDPMGIPEIETVKFLLHKSPSGQPVYVEVGE